MADDFTPLDRPPSAPPESSPTAMSDLAGAKQPEAGGGSRAEMQTQVILLQGAVAVQKMLFQMAQIAPMFGAVADQANQIIKEGVKAALQSQGPAQGASAPMAPQGDMGEGAMAPPSPGGAVGPAGF